MSVSITGTEEGKVSTLDAFLDLIRNMFPANLVQACFASVETTYKEVLVKPATAKSKIVFFLRFNSFVTQWMRYHGSNVWMNVIYTFLQQKGPLIVQSNITKKVMQRDLVYKDNTNILGLIVFCTAFGILCGQMGEEAETMVRFFVVLNEIIMKIVGLVMWYSPIGILSLIVGKVLSIEDMIQTATSLGMYMVTVILGLVIHACITLPLIFFLCTKQNPLLFSRVNISSFSFLYFWFFLCAISISSPPTA